MTQSDIARAEPIYEELPGWWEDISDAREFDDLPAKARDYVLRLEELAGAHVSCIGVGPGRDQTIVRRDILAARSRDETDPTRSDVDPDYDKHGGFPNFEAAEPGPGFGAVPDRDATGAGSGGVGRPRQRHLGSGRRPRRGTGEAARPLRGGRGRRPRQPGAVDCRARGSLLMPPYRVTQVRTRRCRVERAVQPVLTSAATMRCTAACCRCCSTRCSAWSSTRRGGRSAGPAFLHVDYRKVTPIDTAADRARLGAGDRGPQGVRQRRTARPRGQPARRSQRADDPIAPRPAVAVPR